jgi:drug/metabolite transporter (DMT)-like permease
MLPGAGSSVTTVGDVADIIHAAIAPVFLLAGIGAFLNVCALRLARIIDRARGIEPALLASRGEEHARWQRELRMLDRRIGMVNRAIFCTVLSAVLICAVVVLLFADPFTDTPLGPAIAILFMASVIAIGSGFFIFLIETRVASRAARIRAELLEHEAESEG